MIHSEVNQSGNSEKKKMTIPKRVYTFWYDDILPCDARNCLSSVKHHNPDFELVILGKKDIPDYDAGDKKDITVRALSDLVRLHFLSLNGGIWLDIHCVCTAGLSKVFDLNADRLQGFQTFDAAIDSYAFACPPKDPLMNEWYLQFRYALKTGFGKYCRSVMREFVLSADLTNALPYLTIYACSIVAQDKHRWIVKKNSRDPDGPLFYLDFALYSTSIIGLASKWAPLTKFDTYVRWEIKRFLKKKTQKHTSKDTLLKYWSAATKDGIEHDVSDLGARRFSLKKRSQK